MERAQTTKRSAPHPRVARRAASRRGRTSVPSPVLRMQAQLGNRAAGWALQTKLQVGQPGDVYEREADRVASQVMRAPDHANVAGGATNAPAGAETAIHTSRGRGSKIPSSLRRFYESRFQADLSSVRIHADAPAASSARQLHAKAFTVGRDIFFAAGQYRPDSSQGRQLLAHELTHVQQQTGGEPAIQAQEEDPALAEARQLSQSLRLPKAVPLRGSVDNLDPELLRLARDVRATQAGVTREAFRQINVATARVRVDGKILYLDSGNLPSGPHSEEWLHAQVTELRSNHRSVILEQVYSERVPCRHTCGPLLQREYPKADVFFSTRRRGNGAARDLLGQYAPPAGFSGPKAGSFRGRAPTGSGWGGAGRGGKTLTGRLGKVSKGVGRGFRALGRGVVKALPVLAVLGSLLEVRDALASFDAAKAKVDELKRMLDAAWAEFNELMKEMKKGSAQGPAAAPIPAPSEPRPSPQPPEPISRKQSIRVYDIFKHRLRERVVEVPTDQLSTSYARITFTSLTGVGTYAMLIPSQEYECPAVVKSGITGFRRRYEFDGYSERGDYQELASLLPRQLKAVRALCGLKALGELAGRRQEPPAKPDGDEITAYLDWVVGDQSESISATCLSPVGGGNWTCSSDGDFGSLKRVTESAEQPDYQLRVDLTRRTGGQESTWTFTLEVDTPDPSKDETRATEEGSLPEGSCDPSRYPKGSVIEYILQHYATGC